MSKWSWRWNDCVGCKKRYIAFTKRARGICDDCGIKHLKKIRKVDKNIASGKKKT
jgi:rRNA maturation endonuclease Nob1